MENAFMEGSVIGVGHELREERRARRQVLVVDSDRYDGFARIDKSAARSLVARTAGRQLAATSVVEPIGADDNIARIQVAVEGVIDGLGKDIRRLFLFSAEQRSVDAHEVELDGKVDGRADLG